MGPSYRALRGLQEVLGQKCPTFARTGPERTPLRAQPGADAGDAARTPGDARARGRQLMRPCRPARGELFARTQPFARVVAESTTLTASMSPVSRPSVGLGAVPMTLRTPPRSQGPFSQQLSPSYPDAWAARVIFYILRGGRRGAIPANIASDRLGIDVSHAHLRPSGAGETRESRRFFPFR